MTTGGTVEELGVQVDSLVSDIVEHNKLIHELEQQITDGRAPDESTLDVIAMHRQIVEGHMREVRLLRAEIDLLPKQREPGE